MAEFAQLFGIPENELQPTCVLTPYLSPDMIAALEVGTMHGGSPFAAGQAPHFTLIHTQHGAPFVGDAVLHLADSPCRNLILLGACGAVSDEELSVGSVVIAESALNMESFSALLTREPHPDQAGHAHAELVAALHPAKNQIVKTACASFGSFYLEESYADFLKENKIDVVEMEACAFYQAARHVLRRAVALLYVSDVLFQRDVFDPLTPAQQAAVNAAQQRIYRILAETVPHLP